MIPHMSSNPVTTLINNVINENDYTLLDKIISPHYIYECGKIRLHGKSELKQLLNDYKTAFPDIYIHIDEQISEGQCLVTRGRISGTHLGPFQGLPPTGKKVSVNLVIFSHIQDGLITKEWELIDELEFLQQLGALEERASP